MTRDEAIKKLRAAHELVLEVQQEFPKLRELEDSCISLKESAREIRTSADNYYR